MKKLFMVLPAFALAMALAASASAFMPSYYHSDDDLVIRSSNSAFVLDNTSASSNTGLNSASMNWGGGNIVTGSAGSFAVSEIGANNNVIAGPVPCNCYDDVTIKSRNNAFVMTTTAANANSGGNATMFNTGGYFGGGNIMTGPAVSGASSWTMANSGVTSLGGYPSD